MKVNCKCKGTGLIRDKRSYMGVKICEEHRIAEEPEEEADDDWWGDQEWEEEEFAE